MASGVLSPDRWLEVAADYGVELLALLEDQVAGPRALLRREIVGSEQLCVAMDDGQWGAQVMPQGSPLGVLSAGVYKRHGFLHDISLPCPGRLSSVRLCANPRAPIP